MWQNTKLLVSFSIAVIIFGLGLAWFGWSQTSVIIESPPVARPLTPERSDGGRATSSASLPSHSSSPPAGRAGGNTFGIEGERAFVSRVVDGDTIVVNDTLTVRFIGMDTPETVDPRRPVGCFGKEASNETKSLLTEKVVILQKDISDTDKYGRLLRLIYLPLENGEILFINDYLVREGFAKVKTYPPDVKFESRFLEAESQAKTQKKGLWGKCI